MKKAGLITFHASHNFGSMLQAYATQNILENFGYSCDVINFRMPSQKDYYSLYKSRKFGTVNYLGDIFMMPLHKKRKRSFNRFEKFMNDNYKLTEELNSYDDLKRVSDCYDLYVSGSDQIWSQTIPEILHSEDDFTGVYFLDFTKDSCRRIAFATSIGEATEKDLSIKKTLLERYSGISCREEKGARILEHVLGKKISTVLDPTLLLQPKDWEKLNIGDPIIKEKYLFLYTLKGIRPGFQWAKNLTIFARKHNLKVICVSPFFPITYPGVHNIIDAGPIEFINLVKNAEVVFTDSFHGTAFALNFHRPLYSFVGRNTNDNRKTGLLRLLNAENRTLSSFEEVQAIDDYQMSYQKTSQILEEKRVNSLKVLRSMVEGVRIDDL